MKKLLTLISISMIFVAGQKASAVFIPGAAPKPHTVCFEENIRDAGIQVLLTNIPTNVVKAEVYDMNIRGSDKIASRNTSREQDNTGVTYAGNNFSLTIGVVAQPGEELRTGQLTMTLENGEKIQKTLKCDGIMHVMGAI